MPRKREPVQTEGGKVLGRGNVGRQWAGGAQVTKRQHYGLLGYNSVKGPGPEQGRLNLGEAPGVAEPKHLPVRRWENMTAGERRVTKEKSKKYGVTLEGATKNMGDLMDRGFDKAAKEQRGGGVMGGPVSPEGQRFYHGGEGSARGELSDLAKKHGTTFEVATAVRASVSPRVKLPAERRAAEAVFSHPLHGPGASDPIKGVGIQSQAQKALAIRKGAERRGTHPGAVEVPRRARTGEVLREERKTSPEFGQVLKKSALTGPKVEAYYGSYTRPDDPRTKTAVDTHAVGGAAPHLPVSGQEHFMRNVPGASEMIDVATRRAASARGLAGPEGQSIAWHVRRGEDRGIQDAPKVKKNKNVSQQQFKL